MPPVRCRQYIAASTVLPVRCCQYGAASMVLPVRCCQYGSASTMPPVRCCEYGAASTVPPVRFCQYGAASTVLPVRCCEYGAASTVPPVWCCEYGAASMVQQSERRGLVDCGVNVCVWTELVICCHVGFTGTNCSEQSNRCRSNPCQNRGTCINGIGNYSCQCESAVVDLTEHRGSVYTYGLSVALFNSDHMLIIMVLIRCAAVEPLYSVG